MKEQFDASSLSAYILLLEAEELAAKKARMYANVFTDLSLAERMEALAQRHEIRFGSLVELL